MQPLAVAQDAACARVLAESFESEPFSAHLFPRARGRRRTLEVVFGSVVRDGRRLGEGLAATLGSSSDVQACAIWLPPGGYPVGFWRRLREMPAYLHLVARELGDLPRVVALQNRVDAAHFPGPHWYLQAIGVARAAQGTGVGSALMKPALARCDRERVPGYLETSDPKNVGWYERFGFRVLAEERFTPEAPPVWRMLYSPA